MAILCLLAPMCLADEASKAPQRSQKLLVAINDHLLEVRYKGFFQEHLCDSFPFEQAGHVDRILIELELLCRAFEIQGIQLEVKLVPTPNYTRGVRLVNSGAVHTLAESVWSQDVSEEVFGTDEVLRLGEFEKGIYVHSEHELLSKPFTAGMLSDYVGLTYKLWTYDWDILETFGEKVLPVVRRQSLFLMLSSNRGDFTLWEFTKEHDLRIEYKGVALFPVPGVKVVIPDSRKFIVSKQIEDGEEVFKSLNKGLRILREEKKILPLYLRGGFINPNTKDWKVLNRDGLRIHSASP